jgi:hypothetical protein
MFDIPPGRDGVSGLVVGCVSEPTECAGTLFLSGRKRTATAEEVSSQRLAETPYTCRRSWSESVQRHCRVRRSSTGRRGGWGGGRARSQRSSRRRVRSDRWRGGSPKRGYWPALVGLNHITPVVAHSGVRSRVGLRPCRPASSVRTLVSGGERFLDRGQALHFRGNSRRRSPG